MDYYANVQKLENKLSEILCAYNLLFRFNTNKYPIVLTIYQDVSPEAQTELFSVDDGNVSSRDSKIQFIFKLDSFEIQTNSRVVISDALMGKIKGVAKKLHYSYLQAFFAEYMNAGNSSHMLNDLSEDEKNNAGEEFDDGSEFDEFFVGDSQDDDVDLNEEDE